MRHVALAPMMAIPRSMKITPRLSQSAEPPVIGLQFATQRIGRTPRAPPPRSAPSTPSDVAIRPAHSPRMNLLPPAMITAPPWRGNLGLLCKHTTYTRPHPEGHL